MYQAHIYMQSIQRECKYNIMASWYYNVGLGPWLSAGSRGNYFTVGFSILKTEEKKKKKNC